MFIQSAKGKQNINKLTPEKNYQTDFLPGETNPLE